VLASVLKGMLTLEIGEIKLLLTVSSYVLFSIGNVTPLFSAVWGACWSKYTECNENWIAAVGYLEVAGIIVGQLLVGALGDG
jgi:hypothetical protein